MTSLPDAGFERSAIPFVLWMLKQANVRTLGDGRRRTI